MTQSNRVDRITLMKPLVHVLFMSSLAAAPSDAQQPAMTVASAAPFTGRTTAALSRAHVATAAMRDTGSVHRALRQRIRTFEDVWREAWEKVQKQQHHYMRFQAIQGNNNARAPEVRRFFALDCYRLTPLLVPMQGDSPVARRPVAAKVDRGAVCPMWLPPDDRVPADEGEAIDLALTSNAARQVRRSRDELLRDLGEAAMRYPEDAWIAGQQVRFLIDQQQFPRAVAVAAGCRGDDRLCAELLALAHYYAGHLVSADSALRTADEQEQSPATSVGDCLGQDVLMLFEVGNAKKVRDMSCTDQQRLSENLWWLSDPLWAIPGNERYVAHGIRRVQTRLRGVNDRDERYIWTRDGGGEAVRETVIRYGWPGYTYWPGPLFERFLGFELEPLEPLAAPRLPAYSEWPLWLGKHMPRDAPVQPPKPSGSARKFPALDLQPIKQFFRPFTTKEYSPDRAALVPSFTTLLDPFSLNATHYDLYNPTPKEPDGWWPQEHMALPARLLPLDAGQDILWRRDTVVAYRLAVDNPLRAQPPTDTNTYPAVLVGGTSEPDLQAFGQAEVRVGEALRLAAELPSKPLVLSAELFLRIQPAHALRNRYGVRPPPTLRAMGPAEVAVSDLLFMRLPDRTIPPPHDPETAARYMAGSLTFDRAAPVAVYWESYGLAPGDTVQVSVGVRRDDARSPARIAAAALGLASSLRDSITVRWTEPDARRGMTVLSAWKPIIGRSLTLDLAALPAGNYMMSIEMRTPAGVAVKSERRFELRE